MNGLYSFFTRAWALPILLGLLLPAQYSVQAAASLTITPITWNVVGLDSNNVNVGPNNFPVGARVCNTGDAPAANLSASFVWDSADPYINLRTGSYSTLSLTSLAAGSCTDFYFEVSVTRNSSAYNHVRRYHIEVTADGLGTVSTPTPREIFVEHLVSQSRNAVSDVQYGSSLASLASVANGGTMILLVGNTYYIRLTGSTATNGYEQIESFINFPNTVFQVLSVDTTYTAESSATLNPPYDKLYGDACVWENDPNSPNYRACNGVGKAGGGVTITYQVRILSVGSSNPEPLSTLIYDFSGSSYHYNADFGVSTRYAYILDPSLVTISKNFSPDPTNVGGISTLTFTVTNPTPITITGVNFNDALPTSPGAMTVAGTPNASTTGCGAATFSPGSGASSVSFSNGSIAPNSTCTIKVNVTVPAAGVYSNTTSNLFINTLDTGNSATDTLTVDTAPATPAPVCGLTMAQWTFTGFTANPPPFPAANTQAADVTTAAISVGGTSPGSVTAEADGTSGSPASPSMLTYGWANAGPINTSTYPFVQFAIDTRKYTQVSMQFNAERKANGPGNDAVYYSTDGTTWTLKNTFSATTSWAAYGPYDFTGQTSTTGATYFRIYGYGANTPSKGADLNLDQVTFTGCGVPNPPTISKMFSPNPVAAGAMSVLTFTVTNPNTGVALSGINFTDTLPGGLSVASGSSAQCSGTLTTTASQSLSFSGGSLSAGASCTITVTVTTSTSGVHDNISGFVSSTQSGTNTGSTGVATASLTVLKPPVISKLFAPNPILTGGTSTLTFTISNPNLDYALTGVSFSDSYPSGLKNTSSPSGSTTCTSGAVTAAADGTSISLGGATVSAGSNCTVTVNVTSTSAGSYANTSSTVSSTNGGTGNSASDTLTVNPPNPDIALLKQISTSASGPWTSYITVTPGTSVYYRFTVENIGDVPLSPINVSDPTVSPATCTWPATLPAATSGSDNHVATCTVGPITATSGSHINTATASGTYGGTAYTSTSSSARYATPAITLAKSVTETSFTLVGDVLHYSYQVTNSGFAPLLQPVTVLDDKTSVSCPAVTTVGDNDDYFDPGENLTCTATYTITLTDLTAGSVTNTATASAGGVNSNTDTETVYRSIADLIVTKSNNVSGTVLSGSTFNWTVAVNNTGVAAATFAGGDIILADTLPGVAAYYPQGTLTVTNGAVIPVGTINCSISGTALNCLASGLLVTLPVGGSFSVTFAVTPSTAGTLTNTATVDPDARVLELNETNNSSTDNVTVVGPPAISKSFSPDPITINDTSTLTFTITNPNASTALTGVAFSDPLPAGLQVASPPNASTSSCGTPTFTPAATDTNLTFTSGTVAAAGTCTIAVDVTATTAGLKNNTSGNVTSTNGGTGNTANDTLTVNSPSLNIVKEVATAAGGPWNDTSVTVDVGDTVFYRVRVSNTGNVTLTNLVVDDGMAGCTLTRGTDLTGDNDTNFEVGEEWLYTCAVTAAAGTNNNTATADTTETPLDSDNASYFGNNPSLNIVKEVATAAGGPWNDTSVTVNVGDTVYYRLRVSNTGNITLTNLVVDDGMAACTLTRGTDLTGDNDTDFEAGEEWLYTCSVTALAGVNDNTATADSDQTPQDADSASYTGNVPSSPSLNITKDGTFDLTVVSPAGRADAGDVINYTVSVENTGNVVLTGVSVSDPLLSNLDCDGTAGAPFTTTGLTINVGVTLTCSGSYALTQNDLDSNGGGDGDVDNTATADSDQTVPDNDPNEEPFTQSPSLNVVKEAATAAGGPWNDTSVTANAGDTVFFRVRISNTGNITLTNLVVDDGMAGCTLSRASDLTGDDDSDFEVGEEWLYTCSVTALAGTNNNTATADTTETPVDSDNASYFGNNPSFTIAKTPDVASVNAAGNTITYTVILTNTGNVTLTGVSANDPLVANLDCDGTAGAPFTTSGLSISVGGALTCSGTYTVTQSDLDNNGGGDGDIDNTVTGDTNETSAQNASAAVIINRNPAQTTAKTQTSAGPYVVGNIITYNIVVTNAGNVTLTGVTAVDNNAVVGACTPLQPSTLAPGAAMTCPASHVVTQADVDNGSYVNTATGDTNETPPANSAVTVNFTQNPALNLVKEVAAAAGGPWNDTSVTVNVGDMVYFRVRVANTGNITLTNLSVDDGMAGCTLTRGVDLSGDNDNDFEVGEEWFYTCSVTAVAGTNNNTATADTTETPQDSDSASYTANVIAAPGMNVVKDGTLDMTIVSPNSRADAGDVINYTVSVQNTGNVPLTGVSVSDPLLANLDCDGAAGAPFTASGLTINVAATLTCTGSYTLTQNDLDTNGGGDGDIDNVASADSNETGPDSDPNEETLPTAPAIDVTKTLNSATFTSPNEVRLTYTITVQNTGNANLTALQVTDDFAAAFPGAASFNAFSVTSADFTVNPGFNGSTDTNLLDGTDSLAAGASGAIALVVDVDTGGDEDLYINTAVGTGVAPDGSTVQDNGSASAPGFVDPALTKAANVSQASVGDTVIFTLTVTNTGNVAAPNVVVTDTLPAMFDVTAVNASVTGPALVPVVGVVPAIGVGPAPYTVTVNIGTLDVTNVVTIQIVTTVNGLGNPPIVNSAGLTTTAPTNNILNDNDSVTLTLGIGPVAALSLPATGFAPGRETALAAQPEEQRYAATAVVLEIPRLGLRMPIVGVPFKNGGWDVSWLGNQAGWLEGSAFPSWSGNSVLTGHVYSANGAPGPFLNLSTLKYGERVIVQANGQQYIFEIRSNTVVSAQDASAFTHEELSWLTLITCKEYDPVADAYRKRVVVRAVLVDIE